jgi:hypothetical protein
LTFVYWPEGEKEFAVSVANLRIYKVLAILSLAAVATVGFSGCGTSTETNQTEYSQPKPALEPEQPQRDLVAGVPLDQKLVGVWLGEAYLDESRLELKLQTLPPQQQQEILQRARTFMTTMMAVDFRADGTLENDGEVTPVGGTPIRLGGSGTWRAIESNENKLLIETTEKLADGTISTTKQLYRFYPDGRQVALTIEMDELDGCSPMIIFTRQHLSPTNIADQGGTMVK